MGLFLIFWGRDTSSTFVVLTCLMCFMSLIFHIAYYLSHLSLAPLNCTVTFSPTTCAFQDLLTEKVIGHGSHRDGLYYLEEFWVQNKSEIKEVQSAQLVI